jgi:hypothetical protein
MPLLHGVAYQGLGVHGTVAVYGIVYDLTCYKAYLHCRLLHGHTGFLFSLLH